MKVALTDCRLSFPKLFEPESYDGGPEKYSADFIYKPDSDTAKRINAAVKQVAKEAFGDKADSVLRSIQGNNQKFCVRDGDAKDLDGYVGNLFIKASTKARPPIVDGQKNAVTERDGRVYSGCYVNAFVEIWPDKERKGIHAKLGPVQIVRDGPSLGGGPVASIDEFEAIEDSSSIADLL